MAGADLRKANMEAACFAKVVLDGAVLTRIYFVGGDFEKASLIGADLAGADLRRTNLRRADLSGAVLEAAKLEAARLYQARLAGATCAGANFGRAVRSDERRVGKEWVSQCRSRWAPD